VLDRILGVIEQQYFSFINQLRLNQASVERWRWDEPIATLTWTGSDSISRNVHAMISKEASTASEIRVDANAWVDLEIESKIKVRRWRNVDVGRLQLSPNLELPDTWGLQDLLLRGLHSVAELKFEQLENQTILR
jgi:hypothetical protein